MLKNEIKLDVSEDQEVAYLTLPAHPGKGMPGVVKKQISLDSLITNYQGISVYFDFDINGVLIGIEFLLD